MRRLLAVILSMAACTNVHAAHKGIDQLTVRTNQIFWYSTSNDVLKPISSGEIYVGEADRDTTECKANSVWYELTCAYAGTDSAYWYYDNIPTNSYDIYWDCPTNSTVYMVATNHWLQGNTLPDSIITTSNSGAIENNAIALAKITDSETIALYSSISTCYPALKDTTDAHGGANQGAMDVGTVLATRDWVNANITSDVNMSGEAITDAIWGASAPVATSATAAGQDDARGDDTDIAVTYDDSYSTDDYVGRVIFTIRDGAVTSHDIGNWSTTGTASRIPVATNTTGGIEWESITSMFVDGDNLAWDYTTNPPTLDFDGVLSGFSQEQIEDFVGGMTTGNTETGLDVTYQDDDGTLDFEIGTGDITSAMILDRTIVPDDLDPFSTHTPEAYEFVVVDADGDEFLFLNGAWPSISAMRSLFMDAIGQYWVSGTEDGITATYDDTNDHFDFDVQITETDDIDAQCIYPGHLLYWSGTGAPQVGQFVRISEAAATHFQFDYLEQFFTLSGDYLTWSSDASGNYTLVATPPTVDPLDIDNGDIATLVTAICQISSQLQATGNATFDASSIVNFLGKASATSATFGTVGIKDWATINTASIGTALSVATGGTISICGNRWNTAAGMVDDDYVTVDGTGLKAYIDAQDDVCLTQEECLGSATHPYSVSAINEDLDTDEWISPIKLLSAMCFKDTTYFATFTTSDPTVSKAEKLWISGASKTSSVFLFPMSITSVAGPVTWPTYTAGVSEVPMSWDAMPSATETGCVLVFPGVLGTNISNDNTVTYRVLAVPPISAFGEEE